MYTEFILEQSGATSKGFGGQQVVRSGSRSGDNSVSIQVLQLTGTLKPYKVALEAGITDIAGNTVYREVLGFDMDTDAQTVKFDISLKCTYRFKWHSMGGPTQQNSISCRVIG